MKIFNNQKTKIHRYVLLVTLAIVSISTSPRAQQSAPASDDRVALYQALLDLQNPWTVMCVAAHPDDEDGTSLIVMRRKFGAHTVSLFSTFGEGGQNAIGPELYEEMGAIRARETMAAADIQGSEAHFLGLKDFGFSKTRDEAFKFWGHEEGLRRMVLEIRKLRPDVIITNHSTTSNDHGQHQATALMVVEAFDAAADPNKFPEQLKDGVTTWQVQRLFVRMRGNQAANDSASIVTIDPNEKDPVRGVVYAEEALHALQKHATQGPWPKTFAEYATRFRAFSGQTGGTPGQLPMIRYSLVREAKGATPLTAKDSHNFLDGLRLPQEISDEIEVATLKPEWLMQSIETRQLTEGVLVTGYRRGLYGLSSVDEKDRHRLRMMRDRLERAIAAFAGVNMNVDVAPQPVTLGSSATVAIKIKNNGEHPIELLNCVSSLRQTENPEPGNDPNLTAKTASEKIGAGSMRVTNVTAEIPPRTPINVPVSTHLYEPSGLGNQFDTRCLLGIENTNVDLRVLTRTDVAPLVEIMKVTPNPAPVTTEKAAERSARIQVPFEVTLINHQSVPFNGRLAALDGTFGNPINDAALKLAPGEKRTVKFLVDGPVTHVKRNSVTFLVKGAQWSSPPTSVPIFATEAHVAPRLRIGYVRGFDFSLPNALNALGVESKELSVDEVSSSDLSKFTSVIVDNRVYESKPELIAVNQKLLDYAQAGGTLIVFYHKSDEWNPNPQRNRPQLAPYKLILGGERVTDENAPITFIEPDHPLLNVPNKMGQDDFKDWIQERGLYYPREWDPQFHALLQSNDPGEAPLKGGLLVADYGKGHYIYTSMVWYRELRGGIPGAYRMLANMISYGRK
jgi:LmbE family N-acetylglucosaminyl deacetylase